MLCCEHQAVEVSMALPHEVMIEDGMPQFLSNNLFGSILHFQHEPLMMTAWQKRLEQHGAVQVVQMLEEPEYFL